MRDGSRTSSSSGIFFLFEIVILIESSRFFTSSSTSLSVFERDKMMFLFRFFSSAEFFLEINDAVDFYYLYQTAAGDLFVVFFATGPIL